MLSESVAKLSVAKLSLAEAREVAARWQERLSGRMTSDSTDLIREHRDR